MFIHHMPIWATSKDCPVGTFKTVALFVSLSLSPWLTVALLWPSLLHLSPCQDTSFIYRKAFTQINTATQQLPCTDTHTHSQTITHTHIHSYTHSHAETHKLTRAHTRAPILAYDQSKTKHSLPVCLIPVFLLVDCSHSTHLTYFSPSAFLTAFPPSSVLS